MAGFNWSFLVPNRKKRYVCRMEGCTKIGNVSKPRIGNRGGIFCGGGVTYVRSGHVSHLLTSSDITQAPGTSQQPEQSVMKEKDTVFTKFFLYSCKYWSILW